LWGNQHPTKEKQEKGPTLLERQPVSLLPAVRAVFSLLKGRSFLQKNKSGTLSFEKTPLLQWFYSGSIKNRRKIW